MTSRVIEPMLPSAAIHRLRTALAGFTVDRVHDRLGWAGQAALARGDLAGVGRSLGGADDHLATLIRLFLLGRSVAADEAGAALLPLPLEEAATADLVQMSGGSVRALIDIRPHAEAGADTTDWWVVSDFGADVRGGPLPGDHVLGVGAASLTLAQSTPREPVERALDIGTGCGIQALHLRRHAKQIVATDVSRRALRMAATTAALSGQAWDLRHGSLLEPVAGERFDLVVANPPFVVSAGEAGYDYRDSGLAGDGVSEALVRGIPQVLAEGGTAQLLANWVITAEEGWAQRLHGWLDGCGCDAWVWQREVADLAEYVALWLRDAGELPGTDRWNRAYDAWLDWFDSAGVLAVGMGLITMWSGGSGDPIVVCEDVPQAVEQPTGARFAEWISRQRWLHARDDDALLDARLMAAEGLVLDRSACLGTDGWADELVQLRQARGLRWSLETDEAIAALVAGCDGARPLREPVSVLAAALDRPAADVAAAVGPVVRDLVARGFLLPPAGVQRA